MSRKSIKDGLPLVKETFGGGSSPFDLFSETYMYNIECKHDSKMVNIENLDFHSVHLCQRVDRASKTRTRQVNIA